MHEFIHLAEVLEYSVHFVSDMLFSKGAKCFMTERILCFLFMFFLLLVQFYTNRRKHNKT